MGCHCSFSPWTCSYDLRNGGNSGGNSAGDDDEDGSSSSSLSSMSGGRHWRDRAALGSRARFEFRDTGMRSETGAAVVRASLVLEPLVGGDGGVYRCRVDFREAPTRNTRIELHLIGEGKAKRGFSVSQLSGI